MLIEGEKYACEACVRGHRVSNCQHSDRALNHINKKGRPVSQCPHCRGARKARASHVKCECGEKPHTKEECADVEAEKRRQQRINKITAAINSQRRPDGKTCCCTHGNRCTCALKKEYLKSVPETGLPKPRPSSLVARKPRLQSTNSDPSLTHFANGHHKPIHKHNDAHNKMGNPYTIPIPHSVSGNHDIGRTSTDSLPLSKTFDHTAFPFQDSFTSAQRDIRQVKSEHGSPKPKAFRFGDFENPLPPLDPPDWSYEDMIASPVPDDYLNDSYPRKPYDSYLPSPHDAPVMSPALTMPAVDWTALELGTPASHSQPNSYASFDRNYPRPAGALSSSSSGGVSDFDEYMPLTTAPPLPHHHLGGHAPGEIPHSAPGNCNTNNNVNRQDITPTFLSHPTPDPLLSGSSASPVNSLDNMNDDIIPPKTTASPIEFEDPSAAMSSEKFVKHGLTVQDVQKLAHPTTNATNVSGGTPVEEMGELNLPSQGMMEGNRIPWAHPFDQEEAMFTPDGETLWGR
ncbi:MAG: hypothetical protein Q9169_007375 [Polycauliona sp. 2 TL-2023]